MPTYSNKHAHNKGNVGGAASPPASPVVGGPATLSAGLPPRARHVPTTARLPPIPTSHPKKPDGGRRTRAAVGVAAGEGCKSHVRPAPPHVRGAADGGAADTYPDPAAHQTAWRARPVVSVAARA